MALTRSLRPREELIPTQIFTPSKHTTSVKDYIINERRAAQKLKEATERANDFKYEYKHGNIVLEFTPAAYLHFTECLYRHYAKHPTLEMIPYDRPDKSGKIVEVSISVITRGSGNNQIFRINLYNSSQRAEINGAGHLQFIDDLKVISRAMASKEQYCAVNTQIKEACDDILKSCNQIKKTKKTTQKDKAERMVGNISANCPKCQKRCVSKYILCTVGNHHVHHHCEKLSKSDLSTIQKNDAEYVCSTCSSSEAPVASMPTQVALPALTSSNYINSTSTANSKTLAREMLDEEVVEEVVNAMPVACNPPNNANNHIAGQISGKALNEVPQETQNVPEHCSNPSKVLPPLSREGAVSDAIIRTDPEQSKSDEKFNLKARELRQKELKLKKWEEQLKKQEISNKEMSTENAKLQSYIINLESKIKELESSNRILRIQNLSLSDQDDQQRSITREMQTTIPRTANQDPNVEQEVQMLKSKIQHLEDFHHLNRRVSDLENSSLKQRIEVLELSKQSMYQTQNPLNAPLYQHPNPGGVHLVNQTANLPNAPLYQHPNQGGVYCQGPTRPFLIQNSALPTQHYSSHKPHSSNNFYRAPPPNYQTHMRNPAYVGGMQPYPASVSRGTCDSYNMPTMSMKNLVSGTPIQIRQTNQDTCHQEVEPKTSAVGKLQNSSNDMASSEHREITQNPVTKENDSSHFLGWGQTQKDRG